MHAGFAQGSRRSVILLILAVIAVMLVLEQFTGMFTNILNITISVAASTQAKIHVVDAPSNAVQDQYATFVIALDNMGSEELNGRIYAEIRDSLNALVYSFNSSQYLVQPGSYMTDTIIWQASQPLGNYTITVRENYTNYTDMDSQDFTILCLFGSYKCFGNERSVCNSTSWSPVEYCTHGCEDGQCIESQDGGVSGGGGGPSVPVYNVSVQYDGDFTVAQGMNYTYLIRVTNNGDSPVTNLSVRAWSDYIMIRVPETVVGILNPGESASFVLDLGIPVIDLGEYEIEWELLSNEFTRKGEGFITLISLMEDYTFQDMCTDSIERYLPILESLDTDVRSASIRGYDMDSVRTLLDDAMAEFEVMRNLGDVGLYEECSNRIDALRRKIEQAVMAYAIRISRPVSIITYPWIEHVILMITVISLAVVIVIILGWKKITGWYRKNKLVVPKDW